MWLHTQLNATKFYTGSSRAAYNIPLMDCNSELGCSQSVAKTILLLLVCLIYYYYGCYCCRKSFTGNCCSPGLLQRALKCYTWNSFLIVMIVKNLKIQTKLQTETDTAIAAASKRTHHIFSYLSRNMSAVMLQELIQDYTVFCCF